MCCRHAVDGHASGGAHSDDNAETSSNSYANSGAPVTHGARVTRTRTGCAAVVYSQCRRFGSCAPVIGALGW